MVFADPGFVEVELVEVLDQFDVAVDGHGRVLPVAVEGREEYAEFQACGPVDAHMDGLQRY